MISAVDVVKKYLDTLLQGYDNDPQRTFLLGQAVLSYNGPVPSDEELNELLATVDRLHGTTRQVLDGHRVLRLFRWGEAWRTRTKALVISFLTTDVDRILIEGAKVSDKKLTGPTVQQVIWADGEHMQDKEEEGALWIRVKKEWIGLTPSMFLGSARAGLYEKFIPPLRFLGKYQP